MSERPPGEREAGKPPPGIAGDDRIVLFDGVCKLCNGWSRFLLRFDRKGLFRLCALQSEPGRAIVERFGLPTGEYDSLLLVEGARFSTRSDAVLGVLRRLPWPWRALTAFRIVPRPLRDAVYDWIARRRYRIFGRYDSCPLPTPDQRGRFL